MGFLSLKTLWTQYLQAVTPRLDLSGLSDEAPAATVSVDALLPDEQDYERLLAQAEKHVAVIWGASMLKETSRSFQHRYTKEMTAKSESVSWYP